MKRCNRRLLASQITQELAPHDSQQPPLSDGQISGYRIVRKIGVGSRADIYLAHPREAEEDIIAPNITPVVLKVLATTVPHQSVDYEIRVLDAVNSPFVVPLIDVTIDAQERAVLILSRLGGNSLQHLLHTRNTLEAGESVTILAPVLQAQKDLYEAGFLHGCLSTRSVRFNEAGRPTLLGLGHTTLTANASPEHVRAEQDRMLALMRLVLSRVDEKQAQPLLNRFNMISYRDQLRYRLGEVLDIWLEDIFSFADPTPVEGCASQVPIPASKTATTLPPHTLRLPPRVTLQQTTPNHFPPRGAATIATFAGLPEWLKAPASQLHARLSMMRDACSRFFVSSRRRFAVLCASGALILTIFFLLVVPRAEGESASENKTSTSIPSPVPPKSSFLDEESTVIIGEDPVAAALLLIRARIVCFEESSILCLENVDQTGSPVIVADRDAIRSGIPTEFQEVGRETEYTIDFVERNGDAALVNGCVPWGGVIFGF
jgi:hypothetical protein